METFGTGRGTLEAVRHGSGALGEVRDRWRTLGEVLDGSLDNQGDSGRVGGTSGFQDGSGDPRGGLRRVGGASERSWTVGGPSGRSGMGRGTLGEVRDELGYPRVGLGQVGEH